MHTRHRQVGLIKAAAKIAAGEPEFIGRWITPEFGSRLRARRATTHLIAL
jgi:hypothetical protein